MYFGFDLSRLPKITNIYSVRRRTVWQIVDPDTLLILVSEGSCRITMDNSEYLLNEGSLFFVPAKHLYIRRPVGQEFCTLSYMHLSFPSEISLLDKIAARELFSGRRGSDSGAEHLYAVSALTELGENSGKAHSLFEEAVRASLKNDIDSATLESLSVMKLLLIAASATAESLNVPYGRDSASPDHTHKLGEAVSYIRLHVKERITLDDLCGVCNFSKQHLTRVFTAEFGRTPNAYVLEYRINCAKELFFKNPYSSVREVADEMGFEDQHYFTRLFKRVAGMTPSAYKRHLITFDPSKQ